MKDSLRRMLITALLLALGLVLPFLTGQIPAVGRVISPLHIPALICGFTCGPLWGALLGAALPLLRSLLLGMPPFATALPMAFEICAYGLFTGLAYPLLRRVAPRLMALLGALLCAMVLGRVAGGLAAALLLRAGVIPGVPLTLPAFFTAYFFSNAPGALIHLVLVPAVVLALEQARLSPLGSSLKA